MERAFLTKFKCVSVPERRELGSHKLWQLDIIYSNLHKQRPDKHQGQQVVRRSQTQRRGHTNMVDVQKADFLTMQYNSEYIDYTCGYVHAVSSYI